MLDVSYKVLAIFAVLLWTLNSGIGECALPAPDSALAHPETWVNKLSAPDEIIMLDKQIKSYNQAIEQAMPDTIFDLRNYPESIDRQTLTAWLTAAVFPTDEMYINGAPATAAFYNELRSQLNISAVQDIIPVRYGLTIERANVRTFPTNTGVFETPSDREFDLFQETAVDPAAPVIILHNSLRGDWLYVQTNNYRGWVPSKSVAITTRRWEWLQYINEPNYLIVTGNRIQVNANTPGEAPAIFEMGAKLPLVYKKKAVGDSGSFVVKLPKRDLQGKLYFEHLQIPATDDVNVGYLPYTRANIIRQAFKFFGQPYGWGGMHDSVDCSSLTMNVYRTFGISLPRNADQQEVAIGSVYHMQSADAAAIKKQLMSIEVGATLHMNGHVMLYLGQDDNKFYAIHSLSAYVIRNGDGSSQRVRVMKVVVSDLDLRRGNGKTFLESLTVAKNIQW